MHIVVTGGTGLIGRHLIAALLARNYRVTVLTRQPGQAAAVFADTTTNALWPSEPKAREWGPILGDAQAIIHLAGASIARRWSAAYKRRIVASRVETTRLLVQAMARHAPHTPAFLSGSAVGYYGASKVPVSESSPSGNDFLASVVRRWEAEAWRAQQYGNRVVLLRTGIFLSPEGGVLQRMLLPNKLFVGGPLGDGTQWLPWIHRTDWVNLTLTLMHDDNASGPFNLCSPYPVTMNEFAETLGRVLRRPAVMRVPAPLLRLALGEMATLVLDGQPATPTKALDLGFQFEYDHVEPALAALLTTKVARTEARR